MFLKLKLYKTMKFESVFICLIFFVGISSQVLAKNDDSELFHSHVKQEEMLVLKVIASDTIVLENGQRIKLLGIDSFGPPPRHLVKLDSKGQPIEEKVEPTISLQEQAIAYAQNLMEGKKVRLEFDLDARDENGNRVAYVYLSDGLMANVELLRLGFVRLKIRPPNVKYENLFKKAYQEARKEQRGFLSD